MGKSINLKTIMNKLNGQINCSLPKKEIEKDLKINPEKIKNIRVKIVGYDLW